MHEEEENVFYELPFLFHHFDRVSMEFLEPVEWADVFSDKLWLGGIVTRCGFVPNSMRIFIGFQCFMFWVLFIHLIYQGAGRWVAWYRRRHLPNDVILTEAVQYELPFVILCYTTCVFVLQHSYQRICAGLTWCRRILKDAAAGTVQQERPKAHGQRSDEHNERQSAQSDARDDAKNDEYKKRKKDD